MQIEFHPVAESWGWDWLLHESVHQQVALTGLVSALIRDALYSSMRPVIVTREDALLSWHVSEALREAGGAWAVRRADGSLFNALTGYRAAEVDELFGDVDASRQRLDSFRAPEGPETSETAPNGSANTRSSAGHWALLVDVYARERAAEETVIGRLVEHVFAELGGDIPNRWGQQEPVLMDWDPAVMSLDMRMSMPTTQSYLIHGEWGSMARTRVGRTRKGLLEHSRALIGLGSDEVDLGRPGAVTAAVRERIAGCLSGMVNGFRPNVVMVSLVQVDLSATGFGQRARARPMDQPLALLIGPRAVRDLKLDTAGLARQFDLTQVGMARAPSVILQLTGPDPLWNQLLGFAQDLDPDRLAKALGRNAGKGGGFRVS